MLNHDCVWQKKNMVVAICRQYCHCVVKSGTEGVSLCHCASVSVYYLGSD